MESAVKNLHLFGFLNGSTGLSETARLLIKSLELAGVEVTPVSVQQNAAYELDAKFKTVASPSTRPPAGGVSILSINPDALPRLAHTVGADFFSPERKTIGVWFWETHKIPEFAKEGFRYVDEVWTCSRFTAEAYAEGAGDIPVRVFPHPLDWREIQKAEPMQIPALEGRFVFMFSFDYDSYYHRKNPRAVCEAFVKAFPKQEPGGPVLIVKSVRGSHYRNVMEFRGLCERFSHRSDIHFLDGFVPHAQRNSLIRRCNCYVSLHRAEGVGLTLLEAMALGKPCIATNFSGNLDFMNDHNSLLIPWTPTHEGLGNGFYPGDDMWADADIAAAAAAMGKVFDDPALAAKLGARARDAVQRDHCPEAVGRKLVELLGLSMQVPNRPKLMTTGHNGQSPGEAAPSPHSQAVQTIKAAKKALQTAKSAKLSNSKNIQAALETIMENQALLADGLSLCLKALRDKESMIVSMIKGLEVGVLGCQNQIDAMTKAWEDSQLRQCEAEWQLSQVIKRLPGGRPISKGRMGSWDELGIPAWEG